MKNKVYSGIESLPKGRAEGDARHGCLVLEGGAFRGVYGEGVLDALMEAGIRLDCAVGVSAGALNGMAYVSGQIGRSARLNLGFRHDDRYISLRHPRKYGGVVNFDFVFYKESVEPFDREAFYGSPTRFVAVATNCQTGETEYFDRDGCGDIYKAVQASASMQYVSKPVMVDGKPCLDGGCSCKVAYRWALRQGFEKVVVVRTRPRDWRCEISRKSSGEAKESRTPYVFYNRKYPNLAKSLARSDENYNAACDEMDALAAEGRIFVIAPSRLMVISHLEKDMEKLGEWYWLGYRDARDALEGLEAYLE